MNTSFLSPINLAVEPFLIGGDGAHAAPDPTQLLNPNRTAMLVDEIRFHVGNDAGKVQFSTMQAKLSLGSTPLTNQFIPLRSFAPLYFAAFDGNLTLTWHFARPMYVPPDVQFNVEFLRKIPLPIGNWSPSPLQPWGFSLAGRSMPSGMEIPEKIYVPWACAASCYSSVLPFISGDADIGNPFDESLFMDYLCGWNQNTNNVPNVLRQSLTFQATLSSGKVLARDPTPFLALFPPDRPMLRMRAMLQPKEFISVVLDVPNTSVNEDSAVFTTIGMTGYRELQTPRGALP